MNPQTATSAPAPTTWASQPQEKAAPRSGGRKKPTLYVVSCPEPTPAAGPDAAEQDRQASLDLLHRLVIG